MAKIYTFKEHDVTVSGEKHHLLELCEMLRRADVEGTWGDLIYKIEYEFDVDGIRSYDDENEPEPEPKPVKQTPQERTRAAVYATGNRWAIENFNDTH